MNLKLKTTTRKQNGWNITLLCSSVGGKFRGTGSQICGCKDFLFVCCFLLLFGFLGPKTILPAATLETELGDHDFCFSRSHYRPTDTDRISRERVATAGIEPGTSSPGVARTTDRLSYPPPPPPVASKNTHHKTIVSTRSNYISRAKVWPGVEL